MTARQLEEERALHRWLDRIAEKCSERPVNGESHLACIYCHYLAVFYDDQRVILNGGKR